MNGRQLLMTVLLWGVASQATAGERRDGAQASAALQVVFATPTRFGALVLPPRIYRVAVAGDALVFTDPATMVTLGSVPALSSEQPTVVESPTATVTREGSSVVVTIRYADRQLCATGAVAHPTAAEESLVDFGDKQATELPGGASQETTDMQLVAAAVRRYLGGIKHCGDRAHRNRWETDDAKFTSCVCPIAVRWRLPKISAELELHQTLAAGKNGFSLAVSPAGKVLRCRVWSGPAPPPPAVGKAESELTAPSPSEVQTP